MTAGVYWGRIDWPQTYYSGKEQKKGSTRARMRTNLLGLAGGRVVLPSALSSLSISLLTVCRLIPLVHDSALVELNGGPGAGAFPRPSKRASEPAQA